MAAAYNGGVVLGADSRTSTGNYVANRATDKLTQLTDKVTAPVARSARRLPTMSCSCSHTNILARQLCLGQTGSPPTAHFTCFVREGGWNGRSARSRCSGLRGRAGHLPSGAPGAALVPCSPPGHSSTAPGSAPGAPRRQVYVCRSGSAASTRWSSAAATCPCAPPRAWRSRSCTATRRAGPAAPPARPTAVRAQSRGR